MGPCLKGFPDFRSVGSVNSTEKVMLTPSTTLLLTLLPRQATPSRRNHRARRRRWVHLRPPGSPSSSRPRGSRRHLFDGESSLSVRSGRRRRRRRVSSTARGVGGGGWEEGLNPFNDRTFESSLCRFFGSRSGRFHQAGL